MLNIYKVIFLKIRKLFSKWDFALGITLVKLSLRLFGKKGWFPMFCLLVVIIIMTGNQQRIAQHILHL